MTLKVASEMTQTILGHMTLGWSVKL